jgi:hypothetical protein
MKVKYTTKNKSLNVTIDSDSVKDVFKELAKFQEIFDEPICQLCKSDNLQFIVRTVEGNDYYELKCNDCFAKLSFGQHKTGNTLFPKRKVENSTNGWHKWNGNGVNKNVSNND